MSTLGHRLQSVLSAPFVRNAATFQMGTIAMLAINLLGSVVYTRLLGVEGFDLYTLSGALAGILSMFASFGQEVTMTTFVSEAVGKKDHAQVKGVLRYFLQASLLSSIVFILLAVLAPTVAPLFHADAKSAGFAQLILLNSALQFPAVLLFLALQLGNRIGFLNTLEVGRNALQLIFATILLLFGWGISGILMGQLAVSLLFFFLAIFLYTRIAPAVRFPSLRMLWADLGGQGTWDYFRQGFWITRDKNISSNLHPNIFFLMLNAVASVETVGLVRLAHRLALLPGSLILPGISRVSAVTLPKLIAQDRKAFKASALKLIAGSISLSAAAVAGAMIIVPLLLPTIYGEEFRGAIPAFLILVLLNLFTFSHVISIPVLRLYRKIGANIVNFLMGLGIAVVLFVVLSRHMSHLYAVSIAILYVHVHGLLIYAYLWYALTRKKILQKAV